MKKQIFLCVVLILQFAVGVAQTVLNADGTGDTYELINSVLAPGFNVVEVPDCNHNGFGRHIDEVFDATLNANVFRFILHKTPDNDRCINTDRQRCEIKTYDKSPDNLLAVRGELVEYKWKFKLDTDFQASSKFTHLHQIKAVGGPEDGMPSFTLTARKGTPDKLELRYAETFTQTTVEKVDLDPFKGEWVSVKETILFGEVNVGEYTLVISRISDGVELMSYSNNAIRTWKTNALFLRPKWGIYRSLDNATDLRDEEVMFADFQISELNTGPLEVSEFFNSRKEEVLAPNPFDKELLLGDIISKSYDKINIYDSSGKLLLSKKMVSNRLWVSFLKKGLYFIQFEKSNRFSKVLKMIKA